MLLCVPGITMLVRPEDPRLYGVKPVPYPAFTSLEKWPADFENYFVANLGHKRRLVQLHNAIGYRVVRDLQSDAVLVGRKDWLYLKQNFGWESMRSESALSAKEAAGWRRTLTGAQSWLAERGIPFLFVIVPSKETIYPEFLPPSAPRARSISRLDEMLANLKRAKLEQLDLLNPLLAGRQKQQLYDNVDSHWNGYGARIAAELVMKRAALLMQRPAEFAALDLKVTPSPSEADMALILSLEDFVKVPSVKLVAQHPRAKRVEPAPSIKNPTRRQWSRVVFEVPDASLPKAIILRDSFAEMFMPILSEKFSRSVWLWTHEVDLRTVEKERPDIVIMEMTERFLSDAPPKLQLRGR